MTDFWGSWLSAGVLIVNEGLSSGDDTEGLLGLAGGSGFFGSLTMFVGLEFDSVEVVNSCEEVSDSASCFLRIGIGFFGFLGEFGADLGLDTM